MLIKIKELNMPLDEVVYVDIRFDEEISGETPEMAAFIQKAERILSEQFNITVKHLRGVTFKEHFYRKKTRGKHVGDYYGVPFPRAPWCNSKLKLEPLKRYFNSFDEPVIQYVGIAYDEPDRYARLNKETHIAPLYDLHITEEEAMNICRQYDLVSPAYETSDRGGCWFCPQKRMRQWKHLYDNHRDLWDKVKEMEKDSHNLFYNGTPLPKLEERFEKQNNQENAK